MVDGTKTAKGETDLSCSWEAATTGMFNSRGNVLDQCLIGRETAAPNLAPVADSSPLLVGMTVILAQRALLSLSDRFYLFGRKE